MNELILNGELHPSTAQRLAALDENIRILKETYDELKAAIQAEMEKRNILKLDTDEIAIRYIAETDTESFDKARFKKENPDLYDEYITMKPRAAYVTIKVKEAAK